MCCIRETPFSIHSGEIINIDILYLLLRDIKIVQARSGTKGTFCMNL